jgi:hypothetical protein
VRSGTSWHARIELDAAATRASFSCCRCCHLRNGLHLPCAVELPFVTNEQKRLGRESQQDHHHGADVGCMVVAAQAIRLRSPDESAAQGFALNPKQTLTATTTAHDVVPGTHHCDLTRLPPFREQGTWALPGGLAPRRHRSAKSPLAQQYDHARISDRGGNLVVEPTAAFQAPTSCVIMSGGSTSLWLMARPWRCHSI